MKKKIISKLKICENLFLIKLNFAIGYLQSEEIIHTYKIVIQNLFVFLVTFIHFCQLDYLLINYFTPEVSDIQMCLEHSLIALFLW